MGADDHKKSKKHKKEKHKKKDRDRDDSDDDEYSGKRRRLDDSEKITSADYFAKNASFTRWLKRKKGVFFDQLTAEKARVLFEDFVSKYNSGSLSSKYYLADAVLPSASVRTGYKWKFAGALDKRDRSGLKELKSEIDASYQSNAILGGKGPSASSAGDQPRAKRGPMLPEHPGQEELSAYNASLRKKDKRDYRKHAATVLDELSGGKATGFEAKLEKKAMAKVERAAREESPDVAGKTDVYGSQGSDFQQELARRKKYTDNRKYAKREVTQNRLEEHREKEKAKLAKLLEMVKTTRSADALYQG